MKTKLSAGMDLQIGEKAFFSKKEIIKEQSL